MTAGSVAYDVAADILYVVLSEDAVHHSVTLDDLRIIDYAEGDSVRGVEFINASVGIDLAGVPAAQRIKSLLRQSDCNIPVHGS